MHRFALIILMVLMCLASTAAIAASTNNPPDTIPAEGCNCTAELSAEPFSLNRTALVKVEASCTLYVHPPVWKVEWLRYDGDLLIQDVFQDPAEGPSVLIDTYSYPNAANGDTLIEVRFWSEENECICAGNISLSSPVTPTPIPTTGSPYEYHSFQFGAYLDDNGTLASQVQLRADAGPYSYLVITLYNGSQVTNVTGSPKSYITYHTISVTGPVPGTEYVLYQMIPPGLVLVSDGAWEIGPASWWFVPFEGLTIAYNELRIPPGNAEAGIRMYRLDPMGGGWLEVAGTVVNTQKNTITADVSEMGVYALFAVESSTASTSTTTTTPVPTVTSAPTTEFTTTGHTTPVPSTTATSGAAAWWAVASVLFFAALLCMHGKRRC